MQEWKIERTSKDFGRGALRLAATIEEARDAVIEWGEKGVPQGTQWDTISLILVKAVAWLCIKQMERDRRETLRYGR